LGDYALASFGTEPIFVVSALRAPAAIARRSDVTPRPTRHTDAVIRAAAEKLAVDCLEWDSSATAEEWAADLIKCKWSWGDGFKLAKELEDRCHLDADMQLAEILDSGSSYLWEAEREAVKAWVAENDIKPQFEVGARITCSRGLGTVREIRDAEAQYVILPDGEADRFARGGGWIISFDDVTDAQVSA